MEELTSVVALLWAHPLYAVAWIVAVGLQFWRFQGDCWSATGDGTELPESDTTTSR